MNYLLSHYSLSEIIVFIVVLFFAAKEFVSSFDWAKDRLREYYRSETRCDEAHKELHDKINDLSILFEEQQKTEASLDRMWDIFEKMEGQITMLMESDREAIKSYITDKHHFFVYERGWVDDYSLECLERRYVIYREEHGNSFVGHLMDEIRELPKQPLPEEVIMKSEVKNDD